MAFLNIAEHAIFVSGLPPPLWSSSLLLHIGIWGYSNLSKHFLSQSHPDRPHNSAIRHQNEPNCCEHHLVIISDGNPSIRVRFGYDVDSKFFQNWVWAHPRPPPLVPSPNCLAEKLTRRWPGPGPVQLSGNGP